MRRPSERFSTTTPLVKPGHVAPDLEAVVRSEPEYEIVRKREGEAAAVARETDPRT